MDANQAYLQTQIKVKEKEELKELALQQWIAKGFPKREAQINGAIKDAINEGRYSAELYHDDQSEHMTYIVNHFRKLGYNVQADWKPGYCDGSRSGRYYYISWSN